MDRSPDAFPGPAQHPARRRRRPALDAAALAVAVLVSGAILLRYYDRMWLPGDDGYYGHIAQRVAGGEVLHRDVQALHPGYVYFIDALALRLFGANLVSLRYPLVALGVIQAALVGVLFVRRSRMLAAAVAVMFTALSYVLFPTPSVHWYCLFVFVAIVCALRWVPADSPWRPLVVGFLVGVEGFLRQLTGAFLGLGVIAYLLTEPRPRDPSAPSAPSDRATGAPWLARGVIAFSALLLGAYLFTKSGPLGGVLFGLGVPAVLAAAAWRATADTRNTLRLLALLAAGAAVAAAPLGIYHLFNNSLDDWFRDSVVSAVGLSELDYVKVRRYAEMLRQAVGQTVRPADLRRFLNGVFWAGLMAAPLMLAGAVAWRFARRRPVHPLPVLAVFYATVAVHYEAPAYLLFAAAPVAAGLLWFVPARPRFRWTAAAVAAALGVSAVALHYHAGQPAGRMHDGAVAGRRFGLEPARIEGVGLKIGPVEAETHRRVLGLIRRHSAPTDAILTVPGNASLHFLSGRRNPTPYPYLVYGVMSEETLRPVLETVRRMEPAVVVHAPELPYNTENTDRVMSEVKARYTLLERVGAYDVYVR